MYIHTYIYSFKTSLPPPTYPLPVLIKNTPITHFPFKDCRCTDAPVRCRANVTQASQGQMLALAFG